MSQKTSGAIAHISEVVTRVTRILSDKSIKVVQQGMKVGVEYDAQGAPTTVFLPSLTDNPSNELITAIQGFLDKEVSTLLYTEHKTRHNYLATTPQFKQGMPKGLQEIIEDSRTERAMRQDFRGSAANFNSNHDFAVREILGPDFDKETDPDKKRAMLALPAVRAAAGELAYEEFMDGKWEAMGNLGGAILHYADAIRACGSTKESFELTRKIIKKFEDLEDENEDQQEGQSPGASGGELGESSDGMGSSDEANLDGKNENMDDVESSDGPGGGSDTQQGITKFKELDFAFDATNFDKKMEDKIRKIAGTEAKAAKYIPFSRQFDYVGPLPNPEKALARYPEARTAHKIMDDAVKNSHVIQQQIQKLFMSKALVRWEPGLKRGKINASALSKLRTGDDRVFRKKIETDARNVAVSLVIDMSGSMSCSKIQYACQAALMFSQVLTTLNIPHEISSFSTYSGHYGAAIGKHMGTADEVNKMLSGRHDTGHGGIEYARFAPIANYILKGFDERLQENTKRLIALIPESYQNLMANNVDGESIDVCGRRLLCRKEQKKVMIVMSDGSPAADGYGNQQVTHLKAVIKGLTAAGVEMLGLGLLDQSVKQFYPKAQVVNRAEEIPAKILELTKLMVVGA